MDTAQEPVALKIMKAWYLGTSIRRVTYEQALMFDSCLTSSLFEAMRGRAGFWRQTQSVLIMSYDFPPVRTLAMADTQQADVVVVGAALRVGS